MMLLEHEHVGRGGGALSMAGARSSNAGISVFAPTIVMTVRRYAGSWIDERVPAKRTPSELGASAKPLIGFNFIIGSWKLLSDQK